MMGKKISLSIFNISCFYFQYVLFFFGGGGDDSCLLNMFMVIFNFKILQFKFYIYIYFLFVNCL